MKPALAIMFFYALLGFAALVLRGDMTGWPRAGDRAVAFALCLGAVAVLPGSWRSAQPPAEAATDGSSRPRSMWLWWAGLIGLLAVVFLAALPPITVWLARPHNPPTRSDPEKTPGPLPPPSPHGSAVVPGTDETPSPLGSASAASDRSDPSDPSMSLMRRLRSALENRPPWLIALLIAAILLALAALLWVTRRWWRRSRSLDAADTRPRGPWFDDPNAPRYVREFLRLCHHLGCAPRPGDTWRDLDRRLSAAPFSTQPIEPVAAYHYRVRYELAAAEPAKERDFARLIRAARKAATPAPATQTTPAE